ncbi:DUF4253 domain-containing protein [Kitasatospora aureofaciens]|uniref:DUF4253 domain-containing protein n=1 Tax=Kitasatospora aureofaciens TaxID=1894 RepID=UPI0036F4935A
MAVGLRYLSATAPPATLPAAMRVAAEHLAFCPDNADGSVHEFAEYAVRLTGARSWTFL